MAAELAGLMGGYLRPRWLALAAPRPVPVPTQDPLGQDQAFRALSLASFSHFPRITSCRARSLEPL